MVKLRCEHKLVEKRVRKAEERQWKAYQALIAATVKHDRAQEKTALRYKALQEAKSELLARELNLLH